MYYLINRSSHAHAWRQRSRSLSPGWDEWWVEWLNFVITPDKPNQVPTNFWIRNQLTEHQTVEGLEAVAIFEIDCNKLTERRINIVHN